MSNRSEHPAAETLTLWSLGDMGPEESARIASHIAGCSDCRVETAKTQATLETLRRDGDVAPSEGQLAAARLVARAAFRNSRRRPTWVIWAASAAAAVLIAAIGANLFSGAPADVARETAGHSKAQPPVPTAPSSPSGPAQPAATAGAGAGAVEAQPPVKERAPRGTQLPLLGRKPDATVARETPTAPTAPRGPLAPDLPDGPDPDAGAEVQRPDARPGRSAGTPKTPDLSPNSASPSVARDTPALPATPGAAAPGGATVEQGPKPAGGAQRTGVLPSPVIALSSFGSLKDAQIEWPDGRMEALGKGRGLPWGAKIHLDATKANPAVLVLDDGGIVTIQAGKATIQAALAPEPKLVRRNPEAPKRKIVPVRRDRIVVSPMGARVVYVSIPYGYGKIRVLNVGGLGLMVRGGSEVLLQFNAAGEAIGVAELSGDKDLLFYIEGRDAPVEIERDHSLSLLHPERPARPGAVKRAGDDLKKIRLLHARESLQAVLNTASKSWPKAPALTEQLSRLKAETLRLNSTTLRQIVVATSKRGFTALDAARVIRSVRRLDQEGRAHLSSLYYFVKLVMETSSQGEQLQRELDELVAKARKKFDKVGVRGR